MREIGGFIEIEPGFWVPKSESRDAPTPVEKAKPTRTREQVASILAPFGIAVDTSRASATDIAEERKRKQEEHQQFLADREREREDRAQAEAKSDCESMTATIGPGQIDHEFMTMLRQVVAKNTVTGEVDWVRTKEERNKCLEAHARVVEDGVRFRVGA